MNLHPESKFVPLFKEALDFFRKTEGDPEPLMKIMEDALTFYGNHMPERSKVEYAIHCLQKMTEYKRSKQIEKWRTEFLNYAPLRIESIFQDAERTKLNAEKGE